MSLTVQDQNNTRSIMRITGEQFSEVRNVYELILGFQSPVVGSSNSYACQSVLHNAYNVEKRKCTLPN